ncbi:serine protease inhibitor 77Ba-like [Leguminivora glycinivorella]|uniref:serine protease inhibitor 77Ba-like n=1 Tax=Leguminivora glycinivorella TaxID=1035111 RepID=UPI00200C727E|nr:serine protease inhibitor 77Ba-like [Leguminivora glycinivorella]
MEISTDKPLISMILFVLKLCACIVLCLGQNQHVEVPQYQKDVNRIRESTTNFSIELLYAAKQQGEQNFVLSPVAAWTMLAVTAEGATGKTRQELLVALRFHPKQASKVVRFYYQEITRQLIVDKTTAEYKNFSGIFIHRVNWLGIEDKFRQIAEEYYNTEAVNLNFENKATAATVNRVVSLTTEDRIPTIIDESHLNNTELIITSAVYFQGKWTAPFNDSTVKRDFFNNVGEKIGEVNMMYSRYTYPYANISGLQASVIELPYGVDNHMSMILMLPNPGITLQNIIVNFLQINFNTVFQELRVSKERAVEIECYIPRFRIVSNFELNEILKHSMGIHELFDRKKAFLRGLSQWPIRGVKVIHKSEIDVTEEVAAPISSGSKTSEFTNDNTIFTFEANRPFIYFVVEKHTNTIVLEGVYQRPILY